MSMWYLRHNYVKILLIVYLERIFNWVFCVLALQPYSPGVTRSAVRGLVSPPCGLLSPSKLDATSSHGGLREASQKGKGGSCKAFWDLALGILWHHFPLILLVYKSQGEPTFNRQEIGSNFWRQDQQRGIAKGHASRDDWNCCSPFGKQSTFFSISWERCLLFCCTTIFTHCPYSMFRLFSFMLLWT